MDGRREEEPIIEVDALSKAYDGFLAVDSVSFRVLRGEVFAFLGPNGAGKSTIIKMLTTLLRPTSGTMRVAGHDPVAEPNAVRRSFGIVFQDPSLDEELTAFENLEFHGVLYGIPKPVRRARIEELLRFIGLWERRGDLVKHFSGGMKRRLEIARGLLHEPAILFLDEPTLGLDPQTRNHIWSHLHDRSTRQGITIFFTTHHIEEAERAADRVTIIDRGRIVAAGSPAELKERTATASLEDAFLALTGRQIREEAATSADRMRLMRRVWRR